MTSSIKLIVKTGDEINKSFDLIKDKNIVGRDPESEIVIDDIEISRNHLVITREGETFQIEDLNSTNGTFLNGKKLKKLTFIKNGDLISLGENHVLEFVVEKIDKVPEPSKLDQEEPLEEVTQDEEKITKVEDSQKERASKVKPDKNNRKKKTSSQKAGDQKKPTWVIILLVALAFIVIFCVIPLIVIDATDQWCNLFAGLFNSMNPGVCP
jgi:pSer/pThr/pTyr-binding forkhead associated (FHA) protein